MTVILGRLIARARSKNLDVSYCYTCTFLNFTSTIVHPKLPILKTYFSNVMSISLKMKKLDNLPIPAIKAVRKLGKDIKYARRRQFGCIIYARNGRLTP